MAFGINREELRSWKDAVSRGEISFLTHYWLDERFPDCKTVTKVGCNDVEKLVQWGKQYGLKSEWIDFKENYPHFDLVGHYEQNILEAEGFSDQLKKFT
ncbi:hypothetical protein [Paenisporosarcina cavernae]|uniref:YneQ n=1 Tax=Paenisporosarcina cavernae TaxID=2320858 RepID=A0A385YRT0_9BACL|nr:hypothetical protein [Paenisporosarcina cavernae]AYC29485.1 hypothetical protein D3873_06155 [Paenisporosarcina cavernae]